VWLSSKYPAAARVGVLRTDFAQPLYAVARWESYVQMVKDKDSGGQKVGPMWARLPDVMLAKCAESLALRRAFPQELSGLYTAEEMGQAHEAEPEREVAPPKRSPARAALAKGAMPAEPAAEKPAEAEACISDGQLRAFWFRCGERAKHYVEAGVSRETIAREVLAVMGVEHTKELPARSFDRALELVLAWEPGKMAENAAAEATF
jgi:hypothetical protein